jgi:ketosteroid isomerase-like protein
MLHSSQSRLIKITKEFDRKEVPAATVVCKVSQTKLKNRTMANIVMGKTIFSILLISLCFFIGPAKVLGSVQSNKPVIGPTEENALAADQELARAMRDNDTAGIFRLLDKDWAVITGKGGVAEGPSIFPDGIKSGYLTRKTFEISEPRVRLYGDVALVTTKVKLSGTFAGKPFDVKERQTDVWRWKDGAWKCILTHETMLTE